MRTQLQRSVKMASRHTHSTDAAKETNLQLIMEMLKRQENNTNRRLDMLENNVNSCKFEINENIKGLEERVKAIEKSAEFIASEYESQKEMSGVLLKQRSSLSDENEELKKELKALRLDKEKQKLALNDLEEYGGRECIEISGVPLQRNDDTEDIAITIGNETGVEVGKKDNSLSQIEKVKGDPIILMKFINRKKNKEFMAKRKNLKAKTIGSLKLTNMRLKQQ